MIKINVEKAKVIAHQFRRDAREKEFSPYDEIISKLNRTQPKDTLW